MKEDIYPQQSNWLHIAIKKEEVESIIAWLEWCRIGEELELDFAIKGNQMARSANISKMHIEELNKLIKIFSHA